MKYNIIAHEIALHPLPSPDHSAHTGTSSTQLTIKHKLNSYNRALTILMFVLMVGGVCVCPYECFSPKVDQF